MNKCYFKLLGCMATATALLVTATSCSDDEKDYPADIYFTGALEPVQVVDAAGTKDPSSGQSAFKVTFDASSDWTISAHNLFNQQETATWVKFFTPSGTEGSQLIGVYADANNSAEERAATVEITCKGSSISFTLIQKAASSVANPNSASIDPDKTVAKITYDNSQELNFTYSADNILTGVERKTYINGEVADVQTSSITSDARATQSGIAVNKVVVTHSDAGNATYGIVNGKLAVCYMGKNLAIGNNPERYTCSYNAADNLTAIQGTNLNISLGWTNGNLTSEKIDSNRNANPVQSTQTATYGAEPNNSNIDLVWFLNFTDPGYMLDFGNLDVAAMNLMGVRSACLPSSLQDSRYASQTKTFNYTPGVTDQNGNAADGLTVTSSGQTIKVYYAQ